MRSIQKSIAIIFLMLFFSCSNDDALLTNDTKTIRDSKTSQASTITYANDRLIIQYHPGTSLTSKTILRQFYGVFSFEICHNCPDKSIEMWFFGGNINLEPKKSAIISSVPPPPIPGSEGIMDADYEFGFTLDMSSPSIGSSTDFGYETYVKDTNNGITIAILDSGIDTNFPLFNDDGVPIKFLYKSPDTEEGASGWDFFNNDHNAYDDNLAKHGTAVAYIINEELDEVGVNHQILPLKVSDSNGNASYFSVICALNDALNKADVVQMSLGWYDDGYGDFVNTIFSNLLNAHSNVIVVTSAGNNGSNNDSLIHYPSSYSQNNVIAVAATNTSLSQIATFSNYGVNSVDFFAPGENIPFEGYGIDGTSFAAPIVAAEVVKIIDAYGDVSPEFIINKLILSGEDCSVSFVGEKPTKYNKLINP